MSRLEGIDWIGRLAPSVARASGLILLSCVLGAALAVVDAGVMDVHLIGAKCAAIGAIAGLFLSPLVAWSLWPGPVLHGVWVVFLVTALFQTIATLLAPTDLQRVTGLDISVTTYVIANLSFGTWARLRADSRRSHRDLCPSCGYDMSSLPGPICPECGAGSANTPRAMRD